MVNLLPVIFLPRFCKLENLLSEFQLPKKSTRKIHNGSFYLYYLLLSSSKRSQAKLVKVVLKLKPKTFRSPKTIFGLFERKGERE